MFYYYFGCEKLLKSKKGDKDSQERFIYTANTCLPLLLMHFLQKEKKYIFQGYFSSYHCTNQEHFLDAKNPLWSCFEKPQGKKKILKENGRIHQKSVICFFIFFSKPRPISWTSFIILFTVETIIKHWILGFLKMLPKCLKSIWTNSNKVAIVQKNWVNLE